MWQQDAGMQHLAPIPTYEEAISRPSSSQRSQGPTEISDDAERQGFLESNGTQRSEYHRPTVESARNSLDSSLSVPDMTNDEHDERRQVEELDYMEPGASEDGRRRGGINLFHRARLRKQFSQQLSNISATLSAIRLPTFRRRYAPVSDGTAGEPAQGETTVAGTARWVPGWRLPDNYRMSMPVFARLFALFMIASFVYILFAMDLFPGALRRHGYAATMFNPESVREYVQGNINLEELQHYVDHLSSFAHEAGSEGNYFLAKWMEQKWAELCQLDTLELDSFSISANYPIEGERWVKIIQPEPQDWSPIWEEAIDHEHPGREQTLAWHGYSKTGTVRGPLIFANKGNSEDFQTLQNRGVNATGAIALIEVRGSDSGLESALKVRRAQDAGCIGVLLGSSDQLYADALELPAGTLPSNDSLHRTSVALSNWVLGDPRSPGWASEVSDSHRDDDLLGCPTIPSLPISWTNARQLRTVVDELKPMLEALSGAAASSKPSLQRDATEVGETIVELRNENDDTRKQKIWNLHATIRGEEYPQQKVILAAPRDSWCFGASDSASASGMLTAIVATFGQLLLTSGWRPLRTIEFVSWDARTLNSAGSTEYVEQQLDELRQNAVAYINVESAFGDEFYAQGSPLIQRVLEHAMERVVAPSENETMKTMFDTPEQEGDASYKGITPLRLPGSDGDYAPFAHTAAVPVLDFGFKGSEQDLVKGSCYDTTSWMDRFGDKRAAIHRALVEVWALVVLDLVSAPLLPLDVRVFAEQYTAAIVDFKTQIRNHLQAYKTPNNGYYAADIDVVLAAMDDLKANATSFHGFETDWTAVVMGGGGLEDLYWHRKRNDFNARVVVFEKAFLDIRGPDGKDDPPGLKDRPQFKHILYAPEKWDTGLQVLPTIWEMIQEERFSDVPAEAERIAGIIRRAGQGLVAES